MARWTALSKALRRPCATCGVMVTQPEQPDWRSDHAPDSLLPRDASCIARRVAEEATWGAIAAQFPTDTGRSWATGRAAGAGEEDPELGARIIGRERAHGSICCQRSPAQGAARW